MQHGQLTAAVTALCAVIGAGDRVVRRAHRPALPPVLGACCWCFRSRARVRQRLRLGLARARVHGLGGAVLVMYALALPARVPARDRGVCAGRPGARGRGARASGCGHWRTFTRVTLPQLRPALLGGGLVIALHLLAEYGAFAATRLPHLHDRDLHRVPARLRRRVVGRARRSCWSHSACCCWAREIGPAQGRTPRDAPRRPPGCSRSRLGRRAVPAFLALGALVGARARRPARRARLLADRRQLHHAALGLDHGRGRSTRSDSDCAAALITTLAALPVAVLAVRHPQRAWRACSSAARTSPRACRACRRARARLLRRAPRVRRCTRAPCCS